MYPAAMPTGAQQVNIFSYSETADADPQGVLDGNPSRIERSIRVFRTGTFTDMRGKTKTWTTEMLEKAVENFRILRDRNVIPHVPVRRDHTISMKDVGGYLADARRVGDTIEVDIEFTDDDFHSKYKNKTFRNRSLEIGQYVTNEGQMYDPVILGLAFVDLPAVEGLYHLSTGENMGTQNEPETPPAETPPAETPPAETPPAETPPAETPPPAAPPVAEPPSQHGRQGVHAFRVNGADVSDYAAVQSHIDTLEGFRRDTITTSRTDFVEKLATDRIITNPQKVSFHALVQTMTPEQFETFKAGFAGAVPSSIFGRVPDDGSGEGSPTDPRADRIMVLERIISNHRRVNGMSEDRIKETDSWKELQELKAKAS